MLQNLTLPQNRTKSIQGHHFNKLLWARVPDASWIPNFVEISPLFPEKKIFLKGFYLYGRGGHLGHVN